MKSSIALIVIFCLYVNVRGQDLNAGLVGYFPFNGNANDESATNIDGTVYNATLAVGLGNESNGCYFFNGTNSYIDCTSDNRSVTDQVTISYWLKTSSVAHEVAVAKYNYTEGNGYAAYTQYGTAAIGGRDGSGSYLDSGYGTTDLSDNSWHHILAVVDGNSWQIWVDCNLESSTTSTSLTQDLQSSDHLTIGKWYFELPYYFNGLIYEVRIYNRAMLASEITMLCDESQFLSIDSDNIISDEINIYPNPGTDLVTISLTDCDKIEIINIQGEVVFQSEVDELETELKINVSNWARGVYLVYTHSKQGIRSKKLIIQ